tara:strand:+ start:9214 stop:10062 length:849 start_codon:yes stop_codon:yes gene_type:complete
MEWLLINYNKRSSKKYGWHPSWLNPNIHDINSDLIQSIKHFQMLHDLSVDGKVGPNTFRRLLAERDLQESDNYLLINGQQVDIEWDVKQDLMPSNCYRKWRRERNPNMIVTHWDATTSAERCKRVLQARKISTHFCIDNDGVIHQYVDTNHVAWHAGKVNKYSIGVDFSNAYYTKYQDWYQKRGFGPRPICKDSKVHGIRLKPHLGYYRIQIEAYKKLIEVLCGHYNIPLQTPMINENMTNNGVVPEASKGKYKGVVCHYHLTRNKIDCAGLDLKDIIEQLG